MRAIKSNIHFFGFVALLCFFCTFARAFSLGHTVSNYRFRNISGDTSSLMNAFRDFIQQVDSGKSERVIAYYDSAFVSIRVVDAGQFIKMDYQQMISFWNMQMNRQKTANGFSHMAIKNQNTSIHFVEILGNTGYVIMTRIKDLGSGFEPLFYNLIWVNKNGKWYLLREIVHQRTLPTIH
jgi:hypothetical protein